MSENDKYKYGTVFLQAVLEQFQFLYYIKRVLRWLHQRLVATRHLYEFLLAVEKGKHICCFEVHGQNAIRSYRNWVVKSCESNRKHNVKKSCHSNLLNVVFLYLPSCCEETMRANVVLLFAVLALTFVEARGDGNVSNTFNLNYIELDTTYDLQRQVYINDSTNDNLDTEKCHYKQQYLLFVVIVLLLFLFLLL